MNAINNFFAKQVGATMSLGASLLMILSALILGLLVTLVYILVNRRTGYKKDMVLTLTFLPAIVCSIIVLVGNNIVYALSMGGIFTLVRWRSQASSQRDLLFTLFAVAAGAACGIGFIAYGFLFIILIGAGMILAEYLKFGENKNALLKLRITVPEDLNTEGIFDKILVQYTKNYQLLEIRTSNFGSLYDLIYTVQLDQKTNRRELIDKIRVQNGNLNVSLTLFDPENKRKS